MSVNSTEQNPSWEAKISSASRNSLRFTETQKFITLFTRTHNVFQPWW